MNTDRDRSPDTDLREALQRSLASPSESPHDTRALQDRVMAQWAQRHAAGLAWETAAAGAVGRTGPLPARRTRWTVAALALAAVLTIAWLQRPDPALEELMQPDVLQLITLGSI